MYVQNGGRRKSERLHVRTTPELKKRFEEKIKTVNFYLAEEETMDMSSWINLLIDFFITGCDRFREGMGRNGVDVKEFEKNYSNLLSLDQFLVLYWDFHKNSMDKFMKGELVNIISSDQKKAEKMEKFLALVEKVKKKRGKHVAKD